MGLGAILTNDVTGPARQTGLQLAYSYHIQVKEGNYLWNSGIFLFGVKKFLDVLKKIEPDIHGFCIDSVKSSKHDNSYIFPDEKVFKKVKKHAQNSIVINKDTRIYGFDLIFSNIAMALYSAKSLNLDKLLIFKKQDMKNFNTCPAAS